MTRSALSRYLDPQILNRLAQHKLDPRQLVIGNLAGAHRSPTSGFAVEFAGHREYVPGDDPKHIDWRVFFQRDKYFIKQHELETNFVCHLMLDVSASMRYGQGDEQKLKHASMLAVTLGHVVVRQNDKVSLTTFDRDTREFVPPSNSMAQVIRMVEHLERLDPIHQTDTAACIDQLVGRSGRREIVMIISDFFTDLDKLESSLQRLKYDQHEVVLFQVLHHDEIDFQFDGTVRFVGLETAEEVVTQPADIRRTYIDAFQRFRGQLREKCERNRCELVTVDTRTSLCDTLIDYLNERSKTRS